MNKTVRVLLILTCFWVTCCYAAGDPKSVTLQGDGIEVDTETLNITATGNVIITYGVVITGNSFSYEPQSGDLRLPGGYSYRKDVNIVTGEDFYYNTKTYKGYSNKLDARVDRLKITGEYMDITPLHLKIRKAEFTTCSLPTGNKHYSVVTHKLYVYPAFGYLVAFNSLVRVKYVPLGIPVPAFIYGAKRYGLTSVTSLLPDMGIDRAKGIYVEQKIPYFKSNSSNGGALAGFTEKLGWFGGIEHIETFNKKNSLEFRAVQYSRDTLSGTATYHYILGGNPLLESEGNILERALRNFNVGLALPMVQVLGIVKYRDILNFERVSYLPMVQLEVNKAPLFYKNMLFNGRLYGGVVSEDQENGVYKTKTIGGMAEVYRPIELTEGLDLLTGLSYTDSRYENDLHWQKFYAQVGFQFKKTLFRPEFIYTHNITEPMGDSPLVHERNFALTGNELGLRLVHNFDRWKNWELLQTTDFNLENHQLRNCDFVVGYRFHCWQVSLRWRAVHQAFGMGVTIY